MALARKMATVGQLFTEVTHLNLWWKLAKALENTSENRALIGCLLIVRTHFFYTDSVLITVQTVSLLSDSNIV